MAHSVPRRVPCRTSVAGIAEPNSYLSIHTPRAPRAGYPFCIDAPLDPHSTTLTAGSAPFRFTVADAANASALHGAYTGNANYSISLLATNPVVPYLGFIFAVFSGTASTANLSAGVSVGYLDSLDDYIVTQQMDPGSCGGLTHVDASPKMNVSGSWTAPPPGSGPLVVLGLAIVDFSIAYKVVLNLPEAPSPTSTSTPTPSRSVTPSISASVPPTISPGASASITASNPPTPSVSPSVTRSGTATPSGSPSDTASASPPPPTPSATGAGSGGQTGPGYLPSSAYTYSHAFDPKLTLFWNVRLADGAVDYRLEVVGQNWLSVAPSTTGGLMIGGGLAIIGTLDDMRVRVSYMRSYVQSEIDFNATALGMLSAYGVRYDSNANKGIMWWSKAMGTLDPVNDVDMSALIAQPLTWIWAYGSAPAFSMHPAAGSDAFVMYPDGCTRSGTCGGRGDCTRTGACVCDVGYAGATCGACSALFSSSSTNSSSGGGSNINNSSSSGGGSTSAALSCVLLDHVLAEGGYAFSIGPLPLLSLPISLRSPAGLAAFAVELGAETTALAQRTGEVAAGTLPSISIAVEFTSAAPVSTSTAFATNVSLVLSPLASAYTATSSAVGTAVVTLLNALGNTSGPLFGLPAGQYIDTVALAQTRLTVAPHLGAVAAAFPFVAPVRMGDGTTLMLRWRLEPPFMVCELDYSGADAWFGIGFGSTPMMTPADAVLCEPGGVPGAQVRQFHLDGYTMAECPVVGGNQSAVEPTTALLFTAASSAASGSAFAGYSCRFKRRLDGAPLAAPTTPATATTVSAASVIIANDGSAMPAVSLLGGGAPVYITGAHGSSGMRLAGAHTTQQSGAVLVDVVSGTWSTAPVNGFTPAFVAHAVVGFIGVGVLAPLGALTARYYRHVGKNTPSSSGPLSFWFRLHALLHGFGGLAVLVSFALGLMLPSGSTTPSVTLHGVLGYTVFALTAAITTLSSVARLRPAMPIDSKGELGAASAAYTLWSRCHVIAGYGALLLGAPCVYYGILDPVQPSPPSVTSLFALWVAGVVLLFTVHELASARQGAGCWGQRHSCSSSGDVGGIQRTGSWSAASHSRVSSSKKQQQQLGDDHASSFNYVNATSGAGGGGSVVAGRGVVATGSGGGRHQSSMRSLGLATASAGSPPPLGSSIGSINSTSRTIVGAGAGSASAKILADAEAFRTPASIAATASHVGAAPPRSATSTSASHAGAPPRGPYASGTVTSVAAPPRSSSGNSASSEYLRSNASDPTGSQSDRMGLLPPVQVAQRGHPRPPPSRASASSAAFSSTSAAALSPPGPALTARRVQHARPEKAPVFAEVVDDGAGGDDDDDRW